jgi:hypothetical protein
MIALIRMNPSQGNLRMVSFYKDKAECMKNLQSGDHIIDNVNYEASLQFMDGDELLEWAQYQIDNNKTMKV